MSYKIAVLFLLIFLSAAFQLTKVESALCNIGSEHRGNFLLIHGKKYVVPNVVVFRRLFIDNATTIIDDEVIDGIPNGDYPVGISDNAQLAAKFEEGQYWYLLTSGEK
jgi:hypothetical protein